VTDIACLLEAEREQIEEALGRHLPREGEYPERIHEAIRYASLDGGKRLRPIITFAATEALGYDRASVVKVACAIEFVHCCSLVLDDLPSMDDAETRRGRPTTHRAFGVATAILAADALLMHAFKLVAENGVDVGAGGERLAAAIRGLATAVGSFGMVGGQHVDLEAASRDRIDEQTLEYILSRKTGSLFAAAATIGGTLLGASESDLACLDRYARALGLAYQIVDDILDATGDAAVLGKDVGKDANRNSFVTVHGVGAAREAASGLLGGAREILGDLDGDGEVLSAIADFCLERTR